MVGLLADGWFYISSAGLLVSGVLFFFLLGQYRAAGDAADQPEPEAAAEAPVALVRPLSIPDGAPLSAKIASFPTEKPAAEPTPVQAERRRENATGGINPAVVYLQNIKNQLEELHKETRDLATRVDAITGRDEALIERLAELTQAVAELKGSNAPAPAPVEPPAPKRAKKNEVPSAVAKTEVPAAAPAVAPAAEPVAAPVAAPVTPPTLSIELTTVMGVPEAKAEPKPEPEPKPESAAKKDISADETMRLDPKPKPASEAPPALAELFTPAPEAFEGLESGEKPRRGPVWPV